MQIGTRDVNVLTTRNSEPFTSIREHLKSVPDQLETLMSEKRLLLASLVLVRAIKTINKPEMLEIGALSDLRSYFISQEVVSHLSCSNRC